MRKTKAPESIPMESPDPIPETGAESRGAGTTSRRRSPAHHSPVPADAAVVVGAAAVPDQAPEHAQSPWMSDMDSYLFAQGTYERAYEKLGAHLAEIDGQSGVAFAVWAPNAREVYVMGEFNSWDGSADPMTASPSGVWTCFIAGIGEHAVYKYRVVASSGESYDKADPYGFAMEQRPRTASVVVDLDRYSWGDGEWVANRAHSQALDQPMSIYEVHLGSWRKKPDPDWGMRYLTYRELADELIQYVKDMGFTHIELMPIAEHPLDASWGYQVLGYFAPTSRFGTPQDFMYFVDRCHQAGIGVLLDWVPAHFPRDGAGLSYFDGTHLYAHSDPRQGEHQDWGTYVFNYDRNEVRSFLLCNAVFWMDRYHIDGLRVDAVASMLYLDYSRTDGEWVPNVYGGRENLGAISFLRKVNEAVHGIFPGALMIAEESTSWPMVSRPTYMGGLGFSLKWNMGWMHDTLNYMSKNPVHRRFHHSEMSFSLLYAFTENFVLPLSHDEVVHMKGSLLNKMPGDEWQKFASLRAYLGYMWGHPGKKLLFMGCEFAQWQEWNFASGLEWAAVTAPSHQGVQRLVQDLNSLYQNEQALYDNDFASSGFEWIDCTDSENSVFSFIRRAHSSGDFLVFVSNLTPVPRHEYRVGVPEPGFYREVLNTDAEVYWGVNVGNEGGLWSNPNPMHGRAQSLTLTLPPLATLVLKLGSAG